MAMAISIPRYTIADLERFPNDGNRYELLDGVLIVTPSPSNAHQIVVNRLVFRLTQALLPQRSAQVVGPGAIVLPPKTQLQPDILVYPARYAVDIRWDEIDEHWLAVEVLSRSSRVYDREIKRDAYIALGVQEVWLVDRWNNVIEVSRSRGEAKIVADALTWRPPLPGAQELTVPLVELFEGL